MVVCRPMYGGVTVPAVAYEIENLVKRYGSEHPPANDGISMTIATGEVFGLLGPNGAGKTTLVRALAGLSRPTEGCIRLFGHDLAHQPAWASHWVAIQPQGLALPTQECALTLIQLTGRLRGLTPADAHRQAGELIDEFGLQPHANKPFMHLSGGLRRLVSIATALVACRPVLIFDEPTNDLDPEVRRIVWRRLREAARQGAVVILVTHNVVEAERVLDQVAIMRAGRILALGSPSALKSTCQHQVRLELTLRPEVQPARELLSAWVGLHQEVGDKYVLSIPQVDVAATMQTLLPYLSALDDFRIVAPNLEDVYIALTGGERLVG
jgi:ABC-2 type transport system ATP-binding protein